jgi:DNA-binding phage protein
MLDDMSGMKPQPQAQPTSPEEIIAEYRRVCEEADELTSRRAQLLRAGAALLAARGCNLPQIAEHLGVSRQRLHQVLWEQRALHARKLWGARTDRIRLVEAAAELHITTAQLKAVLSNENVPHDDDVSLPALVAALATRLRYPGTAGFVPTTRPAHAG